VNVQVELARLGYYEGAPDGLFGPMTRAALRGFQADSGLPITGAVDEATLYALRLV
jgi:peptidoglycan hydrolase-like protein with peptidoglycan-binding domain